LNTENIGKAQQTWTRGGGGILTEFKEKNLMQIATIVAFTKNYGVGARVNVWSPEVKDDHQFSSVSLYVASDDGPVSNAIAAGWSVSACPTSKLFFSTILGTVVLVDIGVCYHNAVHILSIFTFVAFKQNKILKKIDHMLSFIGGGRQHLSYMTVPENVRHSTMFLDMGLVKNEK